MIAIEELTTSDYMGLKSDGTVVISDSDYAEHVKDWSGIVAISGNFGYFTGLKENGTVVAELAAGSKHERDVSKWSDIAVVSKDYYNYSWFAPASGAPASTGTAADNYLGACRRTLLQR